jgi:polysaccharide export outer membrane protein
MKTITFLTAFLLLFSTSCVTTKTLKYLQKDVNQKNPVSLDTLKTVTPSNYFILPGDNIYIRVVTPDPQWSNMFNALPTSVGVQMTPESAQLLSYPVANDGTIDIPYIGKMKVAGKTIPMVKAELEISLVNYIKDAAVTVRLVNNYVSIIGEVRQPGRYPIYKDAMNIYEVLALAGDMLEYGDRTQIQIMRHKSTGDILVKFSLLDRSLIPSEYFYVMPNDVIYAPPRDGKFFGMSKFPFELVLSTITSFLLIMTFIRSI